MSGSAEEEQDRDSEMMMKPVVEIDLSQSKPNWG